MRSYHSDISALFIPLRADTRPDQDVRLHGSPAKAPPRGAFAFAALPCGTTATARAFLRSTLRPHRQLASDGGRSVRVAPACATPTQAATSLSPPRTLVVTTQCCPPLIGRWALTHRQCCQRRVALRRRSRRAPPWRSLNWAVVAGLTTAGVQSVSVCTVLYCIVLY